MGSEMKQDTTLITDIDKLAAEGRASTKKVKVTEVIDDFEEYRAKYKGLKPKERPFDYVAVGGAVTELTKAKEIFDEMEDIYSTAKALKLANKVHNWIKLNGSIAREGGEPLNTVNIQKVLDFQQTVNSAVDKARKKKKADSPTAADTVAAVKGYSEELLDKTIVAIRGIDFPATASEVQTKCSEYKADATDFAKYFGSKVSGVWSNFKNAAKNPKCTKVNVCSTNSRKYEVGDSEGTLNENASES